MVLAFSPLLQKAQWIKNAAESEGSGIESDDPGHQINRP